jgi:hypothetical protein
MENLPKARTAVLVSAAALLSVQARMVSSAWLPAPLALLALHNNGRYLGDFWASSWVFVQKCNRLISLFVLGH